MVTKFLKEGQYEIFVSDSGCGNVDPEWLR